MFKLESITKGAKGLNKRSIYPNLTYAPET